ncbi:hypothetical protein ONZ45_g3696 [Pleurotus djamor]|nr:hypothetical protein ONZ45_g3696 [Pleurotus djamor]
MLSLAKLTLFCTVAFVLGCVDVLGAAVQPVAEGTVTAAQNFAADDPVYPTCRYLSRTSRYIGAFHGATPLPSDPRLERYKTWFGEFNQTRLEEVITRVTALYNAHLNDFTYICDPARCAQVAKDERVILPLYAFVDDAQDPFRYGHINLCPPFFSALQSSGITRAHVLIHETAHFKAFGLLGANHDTKEWYTSVAAWTLARASPDRAIRNADTYAWFARNAKGCDLAKCIIL